MLLCIPNRAAFFTKIYHIMVFIVFCTLLLKPWLRQWVRLSGVFLVCLIVETILKEKFYFIDVQTLCKTDQGQYLPVEMAIAEFSLEDGLIRVYHEFLHPGEIPTGMRFTCQQTSKSVKPCLLSSTTSLVDLWLQYKRKSSVIWFCSGLLLC